MTTSSEVSLPKLPADCFLLRHSRRRRCQPLESVQALLHSSQRRRAGLRGGRSGALFAGAQNRRAGIASLCPFFFTSSLLLPPGECGGYALRLQKRLRASGQRVEGRAQPGQRSARQGSPSPVGAISAALLGNAAVLPISWMHCRMMGAEELQQATEIAILSANYVSARLKQASSPCTQAGPLRDVATSRTSASSIYARSRSAAA